MKSIRSRTLVAIAGLFALFTIGLIVPVHFLLRHDIESEMTTAATRLVDSVRRSIETTHYMTDVTRTIQSFGDFDDLDLLLLADTQNDVIAASSITKLVDSSLRAQLGSEMATIAERLAHENHPGTLDTDQRIYAIAPVFRSHALESQRGYAVVAILNKSRTLAAARQFEVVLAASIVAFASLVVFLARRFMNRHVLRPLQRIEDYFGALGEEHACTTLPDGPDREWLSVSSSIRDAIARLRHAQSERSEFARNLALASQIGRMGVFQLHTVTGDVAMDLHIRQQMALPDVRDVGALLALMTETDRPRFAAWLADLTEQRKATATLAFTNQRGDAVLAKIIAERVDTAEHHNVIGLIQDVTENAKLDRLKDDFISTVSHELRTPLTAIKGSSTLLLNGVLGDISAPVRDNLILSQRNIQRLETLINDILDLEKLASSKFRFDMSEVDANELLDDIQRVNEPLAVSASVALRLESRLPSGARLVVDKLRLHQIMSNLISNAIKFSPAGAAVLLRATCNDANVVLSVTDSGPGIPDDFRRYVFTRFSQAQASSTRQIQKGTGLGLAIAKELVERMNGEIGFDSSVGQGTEFWVKLPIARSTEQPNAATR